MHSLLTINALSSNNIIKIFKLASLEKKIFSQYKNICQGKILATLFFSQVLELN